MATQYHSEADMTIFLPDSFLDRLAVINTTASFTSMNDALANMVAQEIDHWGTDDWDPYLKRLASITLTLERFYAMDASQNPVPKDVTAAADRIRDLLKMQTTEPQVAIPAVWTGAAYDPSIDETEPELDRLLEGFVSDESGD